MSDKPGRPTLFAEGMIVKGISLRRDQWELLDWLVKSGRFKSVADATRKALDNFAKKYQKERMEEKR